MHPSTHAVPTQQTNPTQQRPANSLQEYHLQRSVARRATPTTTSTSAAPESSLASVRAGGPLPGVVVSPPRHQQVHVPTPTLDSPTPPPPDLHPAAYAHHTSLSAPYATPAAAMQHQQAQHQHQQASTSIITPFLSTTRGGDGVMPSPHPTTAATAPFDTTPPLHLAPVIGHRPLLVAPRGGGAGVISPKQVPSAYGPAPYHPYHQASPSSSSYAAHGGGAVLPPSHHQLQHPQQQYLAHPSAFWEHQSGAVGLGGESFASPGSYATIGAVSNPTSYLDIDPINAILSADPSHQQLVGGTTRLSTPAPTAGHGPAIGRHHPSPAAGNAPSTPPAEGEGPYRRTRAFTAPSAQAIFTKRPPHPSIEHEAAATAEFSAPLQQATPPVPHHRSPAAAAQASSPPMTQPRRGGLDFTEELAAPAGAATSSVQLRSSRNHPPSAGIAPPTVAGMGPNYYPGYGVMPLRANESFTGLAESVNSNSGRNPQQQQAAVPLGNMMAPSREGSFYQDALPGTAYGVALPPALPHHTSSATAFEQSASMSASSLRRSPFLAPSRGATPVAMPHPQPSSHNYQAPAAYHHHPHLLPPADHQGQPPLSSAAAAESSGGASQQQSAAMVMPQGVATVKTIRLRNVPPASVLERSGCNKTRYDLVRELLRIANCDDAEVCIQANCRGPEFFITFPNHLVTDALLRFYEADHTAWISKSGDIEVAPTSDVRAAQALRARARRVTQPDPAMRPQFKDGCVAMALARPAAAGGLAIHNNATTTASSTTTTTTMTAPPRAPRQPHHQQQHSDASSGVAMDPLPLPSHAMMGNEPQPFHFDDVDDSPSMHQGGGAAAAAAAGGGGGGGYVGSLVAPQPFFQRHSGPVFSRGPYFGGVNSI